MAKIATSSEHRKNMVVTTMTRWVQDEMEDGLAGNDHDIGEWNVVRDYGFEILLPPEEVSAWWMPAAHAARVVRVLGDIGLTTPGPLWLDGIDLNLTGRTITTRPLAAVLQEPWEGCVWTKPAEAKVDGFEARPWAYADFEDMAHQLALPSGTFVQQNSRIMELDHEHRFYMLDGKPITGSPYLDGGVVWNDGLGWDNYSDAEDFAWDAGEALGANQPHAYVLDVGFDTESGRWRLIEGNPAWSSGFYGSHIPAVADVIEQSMSGADDKRWAWKPDDYLVSRAEIQRKLSLEF